MAIDATEGKHTGEYLVEEVSTHLSRATGILTVGSDLETGTILGIVTATGKFVQHAHGASDGSETVAGILYDNVDATSAESTMVYTKRLTTVRGSSLTYSVGAAAGDITATNTALDALNIAIA